MWTLHSQKLFFQHFINIFHCWTIIPSQSTSLCFPFPQHTTNNTTKGEEAIAVKSAQLPIGFPFHTPTICAGCHSTTYACRQCHRGHTLLSSHWRLLLWLSQSSTSAVCLHVFFCRVSFQSPKLGAHGWAPSTTHALPFSSGKLETYPLVCTK